MTASDTDRGEGQGHGQSHGHAPARGHGQGHGHGHGHAAHDGAQPDWAALAPMLERGAEAAAPAYTAAAEWLRTLRPDARPRLVVDAGSGPGAVTVLLAGIFPDAEVVAADAEPALLERAAERAARAGLADRFRTLHAELPDGLTALPPADVIWAARSLHHMGDQAAALAGLAAGLAPGGLLALLEGGLPSRWLPRDIGFGRPGLQARLDAAEQDWFARMREELPGAKQETEDWPALLGAAGLRHAGTRSFLLDVPAPPSAALRAHAVDVFTRYREGLDGTLDAVDLAALDRLLDPDDPAGLHHRPDLFLLTAHSVHVGVRDT